MYSVQYAAITRIDCMLFYTYTTGKPVWNRTQRELVVLKGLQAVVCGWKSVWRYTWIDLMRHPRLGSLKVPYTAMDCAMVEGPPMVSCSGYKESQISFTTRRIFLVPQCLFPATVICSKIQAAIDSCGVDGGQCLLWPMSAATKYCLGTKKIQMNFTIKNHHENDIEDQLAPQPDRRWE